MRRKFLLMLYIVWLLNGCSPAPILPQATAFPSSAAAVVPEAQAWDGRKIPTGCRFSSISPNFDWVLYTCGSKLWLARVSDPSSATLVIQDNNPSGTSWSSDGEKFAVGTYHLDHENNYISSLWVSNRDTPTEKKLLYQGRSYCDRQLWSPSGKWILAIGGSGKNSEAILVRTDGTGLEPIAPLIIMNWWQGASWSPDSTHLAYASDYFLEVKDLNVATGVSTLVYTQTADIFLPAWSPDGKMIAILKESFPDNLVIVDSTSKRVLNVLTFPSDWKQSSDLSWSPDSKHIAIQFYRGGHQVGIVSLPSGEMSEVSGEELWPMFGWSRDGQSLVGLGDEGGQETIQTVLVK